MKLLSTLSYSILRFDCLDFDLEVMNSIGPEEPLVLPTVVAPGDVYAQISTVQRMYTYLESMKLYSTADSPNIFIGNRGGGYAGKSHRPCE